MTLLTVFSVLIILLSALRLINLWINIPLLNHPIFKPKVDRGMLTLHYFLIIVLLTLIIMNKLGVIEVVSP